MSIEGDLIAALAADATVNASVGARVYALKSADGAGLPRIVFTRVSAERPSRFEGGSALQKIRFQLDCYGADFDAARTLAEAVRAALDGYTGGALHGATLINEQDGLGAETHIPRVILDFDIWANGDS